VESVVGSLLGVPVTVSDPAPESDDGEGADWPEGTTVYVHSLSSRTSWAPSLPVVGVRVTLQVVVIVPT
jgi:hypothetical protein